MKEIWTLRNLIDYTTDSIKQLTQDLDYHTKQGDNISGLIKDKYMLERLLEIAQSELDREENEPLTLEQLENMLGDPVWDNYYKRWELLINVDKWTDVDGEIELELSSGMTYYSEKRFYKHKPVIEEEL